MVLGRSSTARTPLVRGAQDLVVTDPSILTLRFGEQQFAPQGGFLLSVGQRLPDLVWDHPELVATVVPDPAIPTRWFNERFEEVRIADKPGRYYAYGAAPVPSGPPLRRALTCVCVGSRVDLADLAERRIQATRPGAAVQSQHVEAMILRWENSEAVQSNSPQFSSCNSPTSPCEQVSGKWKTRHSRFA